MLLQGNVEDSSASVFFLQFLNIGSLHLEGEVHLYGGSLDVIAFLGHGDVDSVDVVFFGADFVFFWNGLFHAHDRFAGLLFDFFDACAFEGAHFKSWEFVFFDPFFDGLLFVLGEFRDSFEVGLAEDDYDGFVFEEGLDGVVQVDLLKDGVAALLRGVDQVEHAALEVGQGGYRLHLDRVHFLELVVQDAWGVDDLIAQTVVFGVSDVECLGGEGVGLYFYVGFADSVDEAGLTYVGVPSHQYGPFVRIDGRQPPHMFPDFFQVGQ